MKHPTINVRRPLQQWNQAMRRGMATIGFLGGSITDARPRHNWPEYVMEWLSANYATVRFRVENAAIGATGSDLAVLRVQRDIIGRRCDAVFVEYAVNDEEASSIRRQRTREGLIRQLRKAGVNDIIFVYTFSESMKEDMERGQYPATIAELEQLAQYYQISSIWLGKYGLEQVASGRLTMEQWLPDGLHPKEQGSRIYAECVIACLQQELLKPEQLLLAAGAADNRALLQAEAATAATPTKAPVAAPAATPTAPSAIAPAAPAAAQAELLEPLDPLCWEQVGELPLSQLSTTGEWLELRWHGCEWVELMLETKQLGAGLSFVFEGRGLMLVFDYGAQSAEFFYRIDEGEWQYSDRDLPDWVGESGWLRLFDCGDELAQGRHTFELVVAEPQREHAVEQKLFFRLGKVGVIQ